ncbi:hypothetical protein AB0G81_06855 [Streptomyces asoensis]|uniref:hypothetical protein n=1 Tax=Streptomyces asoensis TaxID=249586 RepID=UPI0033DA58A2
MSTPFEPLDQLPPARRRITAVLLTHGWQRPDIEEMLADYAAELSGQIREERDAIREESRDPQIVVAPGMLDGMDYAASLIDPYHAGTVPPDQDPS